MFWKLKQEFLNFFIGFMIHNDARVRVLHYIAIFWKTMNKNTPSNNRFHIPKHAHYHLKQLHISKM